MVLISMWEMAITVWKGLISLHVIELLSMNNIAFINQKN